jgi:hypothetical protein
LTRPFFGEADGGTTSSGSPKENYIRKKRELGVLKKEIRLNCRFSIEISRVASAVSLLMQKEELQIFYLCQFRVSANLTLMEEERMII